MRKEETLSKEIAALFEKREKYIARINKNIFKLQDELKEACTHSKTVEREENYPGGYLNVAEYNKIINCKFCGKELDRKTTHGSYA